jgi:hypothetical protein
MVFVTENEFVLPRGYLDEEGSLHRKGTMRMATAADEILPMKDPRVQANPAYLTVIVLSRVITRLGEVRAVTPKVIEGLFSADLAYLNDFYRKLNEQGHSMVKTTCPKCEHAFDVEMVAEREA